MFINFTTPEFEAIVTAELGAAGSQQAVSWKKLKKKYKLDKNFMERFVNQYFMQTDLNWYFVATSFCLSEDFIRLHFNELRKYCFGSIFHKNNFSIDFIREIAPQLTNREKKTLMMNPFLIYKLHNDKQLAKSFAREFEDFLYSDIQHVISDYYASNSEDIDSVKKYFNSVK